MVAILVVTHKVDPAQWGIYSAVYAAAGFVIPVAALRYDMAIVLPRDDAEARAIFGLATKINAIISVLATLVMIPLGGVLASLLDAPAGTRWWMLAVGAFIFTYCEYNIVNYWANRRKQFGVIGTNAVWNQAVTAAGRLIGAFTGLGAGGQIVAAVVGEAAGLNNFRSRLGKDLVGVRPAPIPARELMRRYRKMPLLTAPNAIVDAIRLQGITWSMGIYYSKTVMGLFTMAWSLMQVPASVINQAMSQVFFQKLSVTDGGHMFRTVRQSIVRSAVAGIIPFALLYFLVPPILPLLMGASYRPVASISVALVPWLYLNFITSPVSNLFIVTRNNGIALIFAIVYAAVPLTYLATRHGEIVSTVSGMAWCQTVLLVLYLGLALLVAWSFDRRAGAGAADAPAGEGGSADEGGPGEA
ncbi:lipopolysaccharide biosynthesis protein [Acidipropionibacterium timonense]|uniref:lipopolysaccharide biosynthesis protein n=1 Tax=Acidipropionibacterium timonense TaxID=2161818 RepID=UPI0010306764